MEKFGRFYEMVFTIGTLEKVGNSYSLKIHKEIVIKNPLTLDLAVTRGVDSKINTGVYTLYGLNEDTRAELYKDRYDVTRYIGLMITAGYDTGINGIIFNGSVKECFSHKASGETIYKTEIDAWDGGIDIYLANVNQSFAANTPYQSVLESVASTMPTTALGAISPYLKTKESQRGLALIGKSYQKIEEFTANNIFIDSGYLYVMDRELDVLEGNLLFIDVDGGLLGSPQRFDTCLSIEIMFEPRIVVGQQLVLQSNTLPYLNGTYKVMGLNHEGKISGAECGTLTTSIDLFLGAKSFRLVERL